jgi:hypothetical protein
MLNYLSFGILFTTTAISILTNNIVRGRGLSTTIILGAGATAGSSIIDSNWIPPLLHDMSSVLNPKLQVFSKEKDSPRILQAFNEILEDTDTRKDIELLFTLLQVIDIIRANLRIDNVAMDRRDLLNLSLKHIFDDNSILNEFGLNPKELGSLQKLIDYYSKNRMDVINAPLNLMNFFRIALREYLEKSIPSPHCIYHLKLFSILKNNDTVVSFNYDEISDYCLSYLGKLSKNSFEGLGFAGISLTSKKLYGDCVSVRFLKVHGSFSWTTKINELRISE